MEKGQQELHLLLDFLLRRESLAQSLHDLLRVCEIIFLSSPIFQHSVKVRTTSTCHMNVSGFLSSPST